jgi:hypothetical protein
MKKDFAHAVRGYGVNLTEKSLEHAIRRVSQFRSLIDIVIATYRNLKNQFI